jgi:hypothetical protein
MHSALQIDVFTLLTEARQRVTVNIAAIGAQRDFCLAGAHLDAALLGGGTAGDGRAAPRVAIGSGITMSE